MNPDPLEDYAGMSVDVMDTDVRDAELANEDSAYVRSYLRSSAGRSRGKDAADDTDYRDVAGIHDEEDSPEDVADDLHDGVEDSSCNPARRPAEPACAPPSRSVCRRPRSTR
jgi:hypothetical protein